MDTEQTNLLIEAHRMLMEADTLLTALKSENDALKALLKSALDEIDRLEKLRKT